MSTKTMEKKQVSLANRFQIIYIDTQHSRK